MLAWLTGGFGLGLGEMMLFLLPLRAAELGASLTVIGIIIGAGAVLPIVLSMPIGALSDRVGSRRVLQVATAATAVSAIGMALASGWWLLLCLLVVHGLFRVAGWVSSQSYITGIGPPGDRALHASRFGFVTSLSRILGPLVVGASASAFGYRASFLVVAAYAGAFSLIATGLPDVGHRAAAATTAGLREASALIKMRVIQVALLLTFSRVWFGVVFTSFVPLFLVGRGVSPAVAASVISCSAGVGMAATLLCPWIVRRTTKELVTVSGLACGAAGLALTPLLGEPPWSYVGAALVGIGDGVSLPLLIAIVGERAAPEQQGLAVGLRVSTNHVANAIAPAAVGGAVGIAGTLLGFPIAAALGSLVLAAASIMHRAERTAERLP